LLPSTIESELAEYGLKRWDVTRRIQRMNKKLMKEVGQKVAEKRGHAHANKFPVRLFRRPKQIA